ncbi:right-handed parallel beta-helix repeat-containing protein [Hymenobacter sp. UV11]|uniref:right-handed parallel beta-helix repeat-containing protein n=1 Tax=Hymenobacter sp. UV11 TaxID=1849735 RepID=UPI0014152A48|nr:right-handed parallel beta-helix repeat-containing protein [Hymenobacter sp. UV11]
MLVSLFLLLRGVGHAQSNVAVLRKDLKKDFGAVGDGRINDQAAFEKAADFFNKRAQTPAGTAPAVLAIPKGVYLVGRQDAAGKGSDVLHLVGCRNLTIQGADSASTEIRYASGLRYGSFDPGTKKPFEAPAAFFTDPNYAGIVGVCLSLQNCENVAITSLAINGNSDKSVVGGHWGDTGIQLNYDGIFVGESRRITLRGLALHHFGRDGIQVLNHLAKRLGDPLTENIVLENLTCRYNGRQGLSVTGVNGLRATNCDFSHTGRVVIPSLGRALFSNPGAGVDLEPEGGFVQNVRFDNCRLVDNAGQALVSDRPGNSHTTQNIVVNNSLIWGTTNWSAWVTQPYFLFTNCRIYGAFVHGCRADNAAEATRFVSCTFEDKPYHGQTAYGTFAFHSDGAARYMSFTDCRFVGTYNYLIWAIVSKYDGGGNPDTASFFHLRRCTFLYDYAQPTQGSYDNLQGTVFTGPNVFRDGPHRTSLHHTNVTLGNGGASGSTVVRAPGSLQLLASNCAYTVVAGLDIGRAPAHSRDSASVILGPGNSMVINDLGWTVTELYIGPTSKLVLKKGASLEVAAHTKVTIAGQLIVEDGAYFYTDPSAPVTTVGKGRVRLAPRAIKGRRPG